MIDIPMRIGVALYAMAACAREEAWTGHSPTVWTQRYYFWQSLAIGLASR